MAGPRGHRGHPRGASERPRPPGQLGHPRREQRTGRSRPSPGARAGARWFAGGGNWSAIAACESGGNWSADTGNGFYGGLQFTEGTWLGYGGGKYASSANQASAADQIAVAERVLAGQGIGAWPVCGANG